MTIQTTDSEIGRGNRDLAAREQSENGERGEQTRRNRRRSGEIWSNFSSHACGEMRNRLWRRATPTGALASPPDRAFVFPARWPDRTPPPPPLPRSQGTAEARRIPTGLHPIPEMSGSGSCREDSFRRSQYTCEVYLGWEFYKRAIEMFGNNCTNIHPVFSAFIFYLLSFTMKNGLNISEIVKIVTT